MRIGDSEQVRLEAQEALTRPGCGAVSSLVLITCGVVVHLVDGPPWLLVGVAVLVGVSVGGRFGLLVLLGTVGALFYVTWGTWWLVVPVVLLVFRPGMRLHVLARPGVLNDHARLWRRARKLLRRVDRTTAGSTLQLAPAVAAVKVLRQVVAVAPRDHPRRAVYLGQLCHVLNALFGVHGADTADEAVQVGREAVALSSPDDPLRVEFLFGLSFALTQLFTRDGDEALLIEAVRLGREAMAASSADTRTVGHLSDQFITLSSWVGQSWDRDALDELVRVSREMVAAARGDGRLRIESLTNHVGALTNLYGSTGDIALLEEAERAGREAVTALSANAPTDGSVHAWCYGQLGTVLQRKSGTTKDASDLEEAVQLFRAALDVSPPGEPGRSARLARLSFALAQLDEFHHDEVRLREAARIAGEAIAAGPRTDAERTWPLIALGNALTLLKQFQQAREAYATAGEIESQPVPLRVTCLWKAADLDLVVGDHGQAVRRVELAVELIPKVASHRLERDNRADNVSHVSGLAATAATALIAAGNPNRAVELLEQSRGVMLAATLDVRGDLTDLRVEAPDVARAFDALRNSMEKAENSERRDALNQQWTTLLARIRRLPGFGGFLLPMPIAEIRAQAAHGPVVYLTAHARGGHALVVVDDADQPVRVVGLPAFTRDVAEKWVDVLDAARESASDVERPASERRSAQHRLSEVLAWMWDAVAEPVLDQLGRTASPPEGSEWPRIWWCPIGIGAFLPWHAAGRHGGPPDQAVMDRVISSYTPTIRALSHARAPRVESQARSMLIVAVPDAPDSPPLRGAAREAELLRELFPTAVVLLQPDHDQVIAELPNHRIAHFACHGLADPAAPAAGRLLLRDHLDRPLTVAAIVRLRLDHGDLAYLSACSTTGTSRRHADEATHITAAFQLAGYRSVIGTLWPINDHVAITIAREFYERLSDGAGTPDPAAAAAALHHVTRRHRDRYPALPTRWGAHSHTGS